MHVWTASTVLIILHACVDQIASDVYRYTDLMYVSYVMLVCMHACTCHIWCMMYVSQVHVCIVSNVCVYLCICILTAKQNRSEAGPISYAP